MNYPCELIRDLLPLYHDDVCSPESRNAVDEHCAGCLDCKKILDELETAPDPCEMVKEVEPLIPIQKKWNQMRKKSLWVGLSIAAILALGILGNAILRQWYCVPMGKEDLAVIAVYQTSDGCIHIEYDDLYDLNYLSTSVEVGKDGYGYISTFRPILAQRLDGPHRYSTAGFSFNPESAFAWLSDELLPVSKVYLGIKDDPDKSILVWEEGMYVRPATEEENARHMAH